MGREHHVHAHGDRVLGLESGRRVIGWAMASRLRTELVLTAPERARLAAPADRCDSSLGPRLPGLVARLAVFDFIEGWYTPRRRHSAPEYLPAVAYERSHRTDDRTMASSSTIDLGGAISVSPSGVVQ